MGHTYRVGVIGSTGRGNYGHGLDRVWLDVESTKIVAVADDNDAGLAKALDRLNVSKGYGDYRKMLDEVKPEIVGIAPRWIDQHRDMAVAAASRGAHIYIEKPFCRTLAESDQIIAACETHQVKLAIAHSTRYSPKLSVVEELISSGRLGKVLEYRGRGKEDRRGGGEDLWVLGTHVLDLIRHFAGDPHWCMARVRSGGRPVTKGNVGAGPEGIGMLAGDELWAVYGMADGGTAYFNSVRGAAGNPSRFGVRILAEGGIIDMGSGYLPTVKLLEDSSWSPGKSGRKWQNVSSAGVGKAEPLADGGLHMSNVRAVRDLIQAIEDDRQPETHMYEARTAIEMIAAVFESHRLDGPARIPLLNRLDPLTMLE